LWVRSRPLGWMRVRLVLELSAMRQSRCVIVFRLGVLVAAMTVARGSGPAAAGEARGETALVQAGVDVLVSDDFTLLSGKRVGLITNPTGITRDLRSTIDVINSSRKVKLAALFGLEHGVRGNVHAGDKIGDSQDETTGLPVYSLYGETQKPTRRMLAGLDALVYDVQDIGCRSYTYISSMALAMEAAAENGVRFVVLDRPNPLTGNRVEGRPLDLKYKSLVGSFPIPYVYGMTCGELARMINGEGWLADGARCDLLVVPMRGWRRDLWFDQTGLPWVPTSPHIPRADTSMFYAATGIMGELQAITEGVGYTLPFELAGGPFVEDAGPFANDLNRRRLPGVRFRPTYFTPYYIDYVKGKPCGGVQVHIIDRNAADLTSIQFHVIDVVRRLYPQVELFGNGRDKMFDKVCGTDRVRRMFVDGRPIGDILKFWNADQESFLKQRAKYLMYK
jgi:uncharacterized protein YbbC (DUF1343 family)